MTKTVRGISKCPPEIQAEIDVANSLSSEFPLKGTYTYELTNNPNFFYELVKSAASPIEKITRAQNMFKEIVSELPDTFISAYNWVTDVLNGKTITLDVSLKNRKDGIYSHIFDSYQEAYERGRWIELAVKSEDSIFFFSPLEKLQSSISWTKDTRKTFLKIVEWNKKVRDLPNKKVFPKYEFLCFTLNEGILDVEILSPVLQLLKNSKVDTRRIGQCQTCHKFFWRQRANASACSRSCANKYHQKVLQSDEQKRSLLNDKRRENYRTKKRLEKNKNGTV